MHEWLWKMGHGGISLLERGVLADGCSATFKKSSVRICKEPKLIYAARSSLVSLQALLLSYVKTQPASGSGTMEYPWEGSEVFLLSDGV